MFMTTNDDDDDVENGITKYHMRMFLFIILSHFELDIKKNFTKK